MAALNHYVLLVVNVLYLILFDHLDFLYDLQGQSLLAESHQIHAAKGSAAQSGYLLQFRDGHLGVFVVEFQGLVTRSTARIATLAAGLLAQLFDGSQIAYESSNHEKYYKTDVRYCKNLNEY